MAQHDMMPRQQQIDRAAALDMKSADEMFGPVADEDMPDEEEEVVNEFLGLGNLFGKTKNIAFGLSDREIKREINAFDFSIAPETTRRKFKVMMKSIMSTGKYDPKSSVGTQYYVQQNGKGEYMLFSVGSSKPKEVARAKTFSDLFTDFGSQLGKSTATPTNTPPSRPASQDTASPAPPKPRAKPNNPMRKDHPMNMSADERREYYSKRSKRMIHKDREEAGQVAIDPDDPADQAWRKAMAGVNADRDQYAKDHNKRRNEAVDPSSFENVISHRLNDAVGACGTETDQGTVERMFGVDEVGNIAVGGAIPQSQILAYSYATVADIKAIGRSDEDFTLDVDWFGEATQSLMNRASTGEKWQTIVNELARTFAEFFDGEYMAYDFASDAFTRRAWEMGLMEAQAMTEAFDKTGSFLLTESLSVPKFKGIKVYSVYARRHPDTVRFGK